jgi:hypothetical protein
MRHDDDDDNRDAPSQSGPRPVTLRGLGREESTPIVCLSCDGRYELPNARREPAYCLVRCRWCLRGAMSAEAVRRWRAWKASRAVMRIAK